MVRYTSKDRQPTERRQLLEVDQPYPNHNGGLVLFDRTGALLVGLGDGGSAGDPENRAQNMGSDLGKILRIHPDTGMGYSDNPFPTNNRSGRWACATRGGSRSTPTATSTSATSARTRSRRSTSSRRSCSAGANYGWPVYEGKEVFKKDQLVNGGHLVSPP